MPRPLKNALLIALLVWSCAPAREAAAQGGGPSKEPALRIETGMHTATIWGVGVDRAGKFLVTSSIDKTARVWELATGRLLRVLRAPIGNGSEGKLHGVAISPDGNTIAVSGWTGFEWDKLSSIYLFDRESGRLLRRLPGLPQIVTHLAFSADGTACASGARATGRRPGATRLTAIRATAGTLIPRGDW
jgi:WD40 repeat protein